MRQVQGQHLDLALYTTYLARIALNSTHETSRLTVNQVVKDL